MRLFAVVVHDLNTRDASFANVKQKLAAMGLYDGMSSSDGRLLNLTGNMFAGKFDEKRWNPQSLRVAVVGAVEQIYRECGVKGRIFVTTGLDCPWWITSV